MSSLWLAIGLLVAIAAPVPQKSANRETLVAEGEYSFREKPVGDQVRRITSWKLFQRGEAFLLKSSIYGEGRKASPYSVELTKGLQFVRSSYDHRERDFGTVLGGCERQIEELVCSVEQNGSRRIATMKPLTGYVWTIGVDPVWIYSAMLEQVPRVVGRRTEVALVDTDDDSEVFKLKTAQTETIEYAGVEEVQLPFGRVRAHYFKSEKQAYWIADSGLLLAMQDLDGGERFELRRLSDPGHRLLVAVHPK